MKAVSLFSGVGGFERGFERAGIETVLQVEIDPFCQRVLANHWPDVRRIADVRDVTAADCEGVDLIYGGFPCQPASTAGSMKGVEDERWLWPEYFRLVRDVRPRYVLVENVSGLLHRGLLGIVLGDMASIGYDSEWESIPAAAVGAPHLRYRVFIVSYPAGLRWDRAAVDEREGEHDTLGRREQSRWDGRDRQMAAVSNTDREQYESGSPTQRWPPPAVVRADSDGEARHAARAASQTVFRPGALERPGRLRGSDGREWAVEPSIRRVADGVPERLDRLRALGNAVVPQVAEYVGRRLVEYDSALTAETQD